MELNDIRSAWLNDALIEEDVPELSLPRALQGKGLHLIVRELSADEAGSMIDACTDPKTKVLNQKLFMASMVIATLRNGDDPACPSVWDTSFLQPLLTKSIKPILQIAQQSINLSGLNDQLTDVKNDSAPTIVEGSLTV